MLHLQWATETVHTGWSGLEFVIFMFFRLHDFLYVCVCFVLLGQLSHFFLCFGAGITNLNEPPLSFCSLSIGAG